jgi:adenylate kinase family enzyme
VTTPRRLRVVGNSGSGKTSLARRLAAQLRVPHLELDSVQHRPGWTEAPVGEFQQDVAQFRDRSEAVAGGWVVDGNYASRLGDVLDDADCVVWLDYPRWLVMSRVVRRTLLRLFDRRELWNGNRERWSGLVRRDPGKNIVLWAWTRHASYRRRYAAESAQAAVPWVRLRRPADAERWLRSLGPGGED